SSRLARDGKRRAGAPRAPPVAIGTVTFHHPLVEPLLHACAGFAALPVAAVISLDAARDPVKADFVLVPVLTLHLGFGGRDCSQFPAVQPVEDGVADGLRQFLPRSVK